MNQWLHCHLFEPEIISQLKIAFSESKAIGLANAYLERLVNAVIQASKKIKTDTEISSGATSVSFASVQYIIKNLGSRYFYQVMF
jgi:glutamyl-tRNA reductase